MCRSWKSRFPFCCIRTLPECKSVLSQACWRSEPVPDLLHTAENVFYNRCCFGIRKYFVVIFRRFHVTVRRSGCHSLTSFGFYHTACFDFLACISDMELVKYVENIAISMPDEFEFAVSTLSFMAIYRTLFSEKFPLCIIRHTDDSCQIGTDPL